MFEIKRWNDLFINPNSGTRVIDHFCRSYSTKKLLIIFCSQKYWRNSDVYVFCKQTSSYVLNEFYAIVMSSWMEKEVILKTKTKNVIKILGIQRAVKNLVPIFQFFFYHVNERERDRILILTFFWNYLHWKHGNWTRDYLTRFSTVFELLNCVTIGFRKINSFD